MAKKKTTSKQDLRNEDGLEIVGQLEQAFLAGLGALSNAQKVGGKAFDSLVEQGLSFRKDATTHTESLIDDVQDAIRDMSDEAQTRATGLLSQMRETPQMSKLQGVFDARVAEALERLGVASKQQIDELNGKLDSVLQTLGKKPSTAAKKTTAKKSRKKSTKKTAAKKTVKKAAKKSAKASAKKSAKKAATRKTSRKKVSRKKA